MSNLSGQYLGRYHLVEQLGEGGMAVVYRAYDTRLEREVAIKIIRQSAFSPEMMEGVLKRFEREAKSLARLSHPNIVKVHDFGEHEGSPFLVLEYLPGGTLKEKLAKPTPWPEAIKLLLPIARGIAYAHDRGIIHRDIKPANILITESGEPMLSDFGIAKILEMGQMTALTGTGMAIGTPEYMAPEQWTGTTSPQSDLYSLGIVLYEMIAGRKPYIADTPAAILLKQATEPLPRPSQFVAGLPESVEWVLIKTLAKDPEDRYKNVNALIEAIENLFPVSVVSSPSPPPPDSPETINLPAEQLQEATVQTPKPDKAKDEPKSIPVNGLPNAIANFYQNIKDKFARISPGSLIAPIKSLLRLKKGALLAFGLLFFIVLIGFGYSSFAKNITLVFSGIDAGETSLYKYDGKNSTRFMPAAGGVKNWSPISSLDGYIYFVSDRDGKAEIYRSNNDGLVERVTNTPGQAESWSPVSSLDGYLYFVSNRDGKAEIYRSNKTVIAERVTNTPGQAESWSPVSSLDGYLYFVSNRDGKTEIYRSNRTVIAERVTNTPGQAESWSPVSSLDGYMYFVSNRDGKAEIYRSNRTVIAERVTNTSGPAESWSPTVLGKDIYFTSNRSGRNQIFRLGTPTVAISNLESWFKQSPLEDKSSH